MASGIAAVSVDEYIRLFPPATQKMLRQLRQIIRSTAPKATEGISYGIAGYKHQGTLIFFAGFKNHIGIYPAPRQVPAFQKELAAYKGGKGTVQFPLDQPLPEALIRKIVRYRLKENEEKAIALPKKKTTRKNTDKPDAATVVENWLQQLDPDKRKLVNTVRKIIKSSDPGLQERIKWNAPSYYYKEDILTFGPSRDERILLVFHHPAVVKVKSSILEGNYPNRRLVYLQHAADANRKKSEIKKIITQIIQSIK